VLTIFELVGVFWVYGIENFCWDVEFMLSREIGGFWRIMWVIVTPVLMIVIFVYSMIELENPTYTGKNYPTPYLIAGWVIFAIGMLQIVMWSAFLIMRNPDKSEKFKNLFRKNPSWQPKSPKIAKQWRAYKENELEKRRALSDGHSSVKKFWLILGRKYN
jgi:solute carrier family 6 amino acid transporter-like protein 5/7/9/14